MSESASNKSKQRSTAVRIFAYCINKLWLLLAAVIIFAALVHIALGLLLPKIDSYNQEITDWVKQNYDLTIDISELSAEWNIQGPSLGLKDFRVKSADGAYDLLHIRKVSVEVDLLASIFDKRISTEDIKIDGADIQFYISSELGVALSNDSDPSALENIGLESISQQLFDALFGQRRITIVNSNLNLYTLAGTEFKYLIDELEVVKYDEIHQLFGRLSYTGGGDVTIISEVYGDPTKEDSYSNVYLEGAQIDIAELPWFNLPAEYSPQHGNLSWKFWGNWQDKHWQSAKAIIELDNATLGNQTIQDNQLSTMISWEHRDLQFGYLALHNTQFKIAQDNQVSADSLIHFSRTKSSDIQWDLFVTQLNSKPISDYLQSVLEPENSLTKFFENTNAGAQIDSMHVSLNKTGNQWQPLTFELDFSNLSVDAYQSFPDLKKLNGTVEYTNNAGNLKLNAIETEIVIPELFRHSLQARTLSADASWAFNQQQELQFNIESFQVTNKDFELIATGALQTIDEQLILNLYSELHQASVANKSLYLPVGVMTEELVSYLDSSIKAGTLTLAKGLVRGPVTEFPFDNLNGVFIAHGEVEEASFKYLPDWPIANALNAQLLFEGSMMDIKATKGESLGNQVDFARAYASDLSKDNAMLNLSLNVDSQNNSGKAFLKLTPLDFIYEAIEDIDYQGKLASEIKLDINLDNPDQISLNGQVEFEKGKSKLTTSIVDATNLVGRLKFTENGLSPSDIQADFFGKALEVKVRSGNNQEEPLLSLDIRGDLPVTGITHFIGEQWQPFFDGESKFTSLVQFAPADNPDITRVLLQTDLKGMQLNFPGEFGKSAEQVAETYLTLDVGAVSTGEIRWGGISGNWYWSQKAQNTQPLASKPSTSETEDEFAYHTVKLEYGGDFFVNTKKSLPTSLDSGLRVSGNLQPQILDEWLWFISELEQQAVENDQDEFELVFEKIDLQVEQLDAGITQVESLNVELNKLASQPWKLKVDNQQLEGVLTLNEYSPWVIDIKSADLNIGVLDSKRDSANQSSHTADPNLPAEESIREKSSQDDKPSLEVSEIEKTNSPVSQEQEVNSESPNSFSPLQLKAMDFRCSNCTFNQVEYGEILAEVRESPKGISMLGRVRKGTEHNIAVSGVWVETEDAQQETQLLMELNSDNIGQFLKQWDLDATVEDSSGQVIANTWWTGSPWQMDYKQLDGDFQLALGKGYLSEISDEQGRLFSLFNLQSILRKLTFDFKDVYQKGFFYDSINGTIRMRDGIVSTENVEIEGNVADVKLYGETDLRKQTIDQTAVITPHLTSSFPVLAAWAVEPTTGLLVFLLDKIMEPAVEVATRLDYRISGTFDEVVVEEMKRAKKKIKVEYASEQPAEEKQSEQTNDETGNQLNNKNTELQSIENESNSSNNQEKSIDLELSTNQDIRADKRLMNQDKHQGRDQDLEQVQEQVQESKNNSNKPEKPKPDPTEQ